MFQPVEIPRLFDSLEAATLEGKLSQMARDVVRLLEAGVSIEHIGLAIAQLDATYADYGTTHVLPVTVDALRIRSAIRATKRCCR